MLSLKDQARLNAIRYAWKHNPGEFQGPEYYAAEADVLLKWEHSIKYKQAANSFPKITITKQELYDPATEPIGLFYRYSITVEPAGFGFTRTYGPMTVREYVADFKGKLYVGLGTPDIADLFRRYSDPTCTYVDPNPIEIVILGEMN